MPIFVDVTSVDASNDLGAISVLDKRKDEYEAKDEDGYNLPAI